MSELVRIKKISTGEHKMVTPAFASRTKMLKNSGWVVEDLPETKTYIPKEVIEKAPEIISEIEEILNSNKEEIDENAPLSYREANKEVVEPKKRGRQPGSTNKPK